MRGLVIFGLGIATGHMGKEPKIPAIKTAAILGVGFGMGYSAAMGAQGQNEELKEATADFIRTLKAVATDAWLDVKQEMADTKKAAEATPEDIINGAAEQPENNETSDTEDDEEPVVDVDDVIPPQGETP